MNEIRLDSNFATMQNRGTGLLPVSLLTFGIALVATACGSSPVPSPSGGAGGTKSGGSSGRAGALAQGGSNAGRASTGGNGGVGVAGGSAGKAGSSTIGGANSIGGTATNVGGSTGTGGNRTGGTSSTVGGTNAVTGGNASIGGASGGASNAGGSSAANSGGTTGTTGGTTTVGPSGGTTGTTGGAGTTGGSGPDPLCANVTCTAGMQCVAGLCRCPSTFLYCTGACVDPPTVTSDPAHCGTVGTCGVACPSGGSCVGGVCQCPSGTTTCDAGTASAVCADFQTNNSHCGACGNACAAPSLCQAGSCVCPTNYTMCTTGCVNTSIDLQNCGGCNQPCSGICTGGSCAASSCTANMPQQGYTTTAYAQIVLGKYWINNNLWGISGATGQQGIWSTCSSGNTIGWGTDWSWSGGSNGVKSYASAVLGWHWGWLVPSGTGLPIQISAASNITCGWTFRVVPGGTINVSYDLWTHTVSNPNSTSSPADEIMIWLYRQGAGPIGTSQQTGVQIAATPWTLYRGMNGTTNVYSYVRETNTTSATMNLMDFLNDLVSRTWLQSSKYLSSIQAGTEVYTGTGRLDTDTYYCTVQ